MKYDQQASVIVVEAMYTAQRIPAFGGNPLIEALPPVMTEEQLIESLARWPAYSENQRQWTTPERVMMLLELQNFLAPTFNQIELCLSLDSMVRNGYVGRAPRTPGHAQISMEVYRRQVEGKGYTQPADCITPHISTALIGLSGMGKTTTLKRWAARLPSVIFHSKLNVWQVPVIHIETPSDGKSAKGLCHQILMALDRVLPGSDYYNLYARGGRTASESLITQVEALMNRHCVGMLICDEVQNLLNAQKGREVLMSELLSMSNKLRTPLLLVGTNKAARLCSTTFSQGRRSSGFGVPSWDRLTPGTDDEPGEWGPFIELLWQYQWTREYCPLTPELSKQMYFYSQGIIDVAIKLFAVAQGKAMIRLTEVLTPELLEEVYTRDFKFMHAMLDALRTNNLERLMEFDDIAPIDLQQFFENEERKKKASRSPLHALRPSNPTYKPRMTEALVRVGLDEEHAKALSESVAAENSTRSLGDGLVAAIKKSKPAPRQRPKANKIPEALASNRFDSRLHDYRRATAYSQASEGGTALQHLIELGMAPRLEDILSLD